MAREIILHKTNEEWNQKLNHFGQRHPNYHNICKTQWLYQKGNAAVLCRFDFIQLRSSYPNMRPLTNEPENVLCTCLH